MREQKYEQRIKIWDGTSERDANVLNSLCFNPIKRAIISGKKWVNSLNTLGLSIYNFEVG